MGAIKRSRGEVAGIIEQFLDGAGAKWDWDDFCSIEIDDPELDHIRVQCSTVSSTFPPTEKGHFCSSPGYDYLRGIARDLRASPI
jgi:hypothetical protein